MYFFNLIIHAISTSQNQVVWVVENCLDDEKGVGHSGVVAIKSVMEDLRVCVRKGVVEKLSDGNYLSIYLYVYILNMIYLISTIQTALLACVSPIFLTCLTTPVWTRGFTALQREPMSVCNALVSILST
jgi:hypothetical protein